MPRPRGSKPAQKVRGFALVAEVHHRQRRARDARELLHERRLPRARLADEKRGFRHLHRGGDAFEDAHGVSRLRPSPPAPRGTHRHRGGGGFLRGEHRATHRHRGGARLHGGFPHEILVFGGVGAYAPTRRHRLEDAPPSGSRGEHAREDVHRLLVRRDANLGG